MTEQQRLEAECDRLRAELANALAREELFRELVERTTDAVYFKDLDGRYGYLNAAAAAFLSSSPEDALGKTDAELLGAVAGRAIREGDLAVMKAGTAQTYEDAEMPHEGGSYYFSSTKYPRFSADGQVVGLLGISRDITRRKHAELLVQAKNKELADLALLLEQRSEEIQAQNEELQVQSEELQAQNEEIQAQSEELLATNATLNQALDELKQLDQLKQDFLNAASHELRTPLTSIAGYAEFLMDGIGGELPSQQLAYVSEILSGTTRLQRIIDDMLDFARLEAGTFQLSMGESDLVPLLRNELASLHPQASAKQLTLDLEAPETGVPLRMDASRIGQVLLNLVSNAIKFTPAGGRISVKLVRAEDAVRVEVQDTGIGIAPDHQHRLFQKFYQVDRKHTREYSGAGLGLSICKSLIEAHGGAIGLESDLGQGSTFWFSLPLGATACKA